MENSSLIEILKTFSKKEIKEFALFVDSPFYNKNQNVVKLCELLIKLYPHFRKEKIFKEDLFKKIFPKQPYNDENMKTIIYLLARLAEKYIIQVQFHAHPYDEQEKLLQAFYQRKLEKQFRKYEKITEESLAKTKGMDINALNNRIGFLKVRRAFYQGRFNAEQIFEQDFKLGEYLITEALALLFILTNNLNMMKAGLLSHKTGFDFVTEFINSIDFASLFKTYRANSFELMPLLEVYYKMYLTSSDPSSEAAFNDFKNTLENNINSFTKREQYILYILLSNCIAERLINDRDKYNREFCEAYKKIISIQRYSDEPHLSSSTYHISLRYGLLVKDFEWVDQLISEHAGRLHPLEKENMLNYSYAHLYFAKKDFGKALDFVSKVNFENGEIKYHIRNLLLMVYYEMGELESALAMIDSYKHFIKMDKSETDVIRNGHLDFLNKTLQLIGYRTGKGKTDPEILKREVENSNVVRKVWLLEKIGEMEEK